MGGDLDRENGRINDTEVLRAVDPTGRQLTYSDQASHNSLELVVHHTAVLARQHSRAAEPVGGGVSGLLVPRFPVSVRRASGDVDVGGADDGAEGLGGEHGLRLLGDGDGDLDVEVVGEEARGDGGGCEGLKEL